LALSYHSEIKTKSPTRYVGLKIAGSPTKDYYNQDFEGIWGLWIYWGTEAEIRVNKRVLSESFTIPELKKTAQW